MIGAGSGFVLQVAAEVTNPFFAGSEFVIMDISQERLDESEKMVAELLAANDVGISLKSTTSEAEALDGANYVISSCEQKRWEFWLKDLKIPEKYGVYMVTAENGGPGGQIHALRNIGMYSKIAKAMERYCPNAWLMNFSNPLSFLSTYLNKYSKIKTLGFCHQVHGSFGVVAEMLGFEPGDLEPISGGVNHFNWLVDVRRKGSAKSFLPEFIHRVRESKYWREQFKDIPDHRLTLDVLNTFGAYPVGYDDHIVEYLPIFYERHEWEKLGIYSCEEWLHGKINDNRGNTLETVYRLVKGEIMHPFPKDDNHPYYKEEPCRVIQALETNIPTYIDAMNIMNHGSISNLPPDAIVDIPALVIGGAVRGIHVGELPLGAMELCRRQITIHEMVARSAHEGDPNLFLQSLCLDPYVHSITQAKAIWKDYLEEYKDVLPMFRESRK